MSTRYVKVPDEFAPLFEKAEKVVSRYFDEKKEEPEKGVITIADDRYVMIRAESMSVNFMEHMASIFDVEQAMNFLYSFAKVIGKNDASAFHDKMGLVDPVEKLSAGPVIFSFTGWAMVDISPESKPTPDKNYLLVYDHPNTFEADSYIKHGLNKDPDRKVCVFSAGYSAGWCSESFGLNLDAEEIMCRVRGDDICRFVMSPPDRIREHVEERLNKGCCSHE